jgi:hypothetical protein
MRTSLLLSIVFLAACGGSPTGAECPTTDPPTYDNFGQAFVDEYCIACHSHDSANRHGAPADQNYDSEDEIISHVVDMDEQAASGPAATNSSMPDLSGPVHDAPTMAERIQLGQFLACEMNK